MLSSHTRSHLPPPFPFPQPALPTAQSVPLPRRALGVAMGTTIVLSRLSAMRALVRLASIATMITRNYAQASIHY